MEGHPAFVMVAPARRSEVADALGVVCPDLAGASRGWRTSGCSRSFSHAGMAIAGVDVGESLRQPERLRAGYSAFYKELVEKRGFAKKACLLAQSRGGLMLYNWAC